MNLRLRTRRLAAAVTVLAAALVGPLVVAGPARAATPAKSCGTTIVWDAVSYQMCEFYKGHDSFGLVIWTYQLSIYNNSGRTLNMSYSYGSQYWLDPRDARAEGTPDILLQLPPGQFKSAERQGIGLPGLFVRSFGRVSSRKQLPPTPGEWAIGPTFQCH